jgi:hypothetical protein
MDAAIEAMEREGEGEEIGYVGVAKKYGVDESTLRRRHQGKCTTRAEAAQMRQKLNPKQEEELCKYINTLTERALPPTRMMVASFASQICKKEVGVNWVSRFLKRHQDKLSPKWTTGMDRVRYKADTEGSSINVCNGGNASVSGCLRPLLLEAFPPRLALVTMPL